jgi:hypothetical protein
MTRPLLATLAFLVATPALSQPVTASAQAPGLPAPPPARDTLPQTGTARIRGHVYAAETGAPLRRAQVRVFAPELRDPRQTATDERGAYEFKDLPAGRFTVNASKGSYVALSYGQTRPMQSGTPLQVLDGQTVEKVDFALPRGSVITGRVVDEFGEPIADVQVMPMQSRFAQGRRRLLPTGRTGQTNDIGEYRLFGLSPGEYYVSATLRTFNGSNVDSDDRGGYAATYYPGTANGSEAQRIFVGVGQAVSEINISLVATRTARITGTVVDALGKPVLQGFVSAMPRGTGGMFFGPAVGGQIREGAFMVSSVTPGDYILRANLGTGTDGRTEFATANVTVTGEDISGVSLAPMPMVTVTGRIMAQDPAAAPSLKLPIRITFIPVEPDDQMAMPGGGATVKEDFTFEAKVSPGKFRVYGGAPAPGWTIHTVRQNGVDVTDSLDVLPSGDTSGIEIEFTNHLSELSGVVTNQRGEAAREYTVIVFSQDREQWTGNTRYRGEGRPDQDGRFKVRGLPAGRYYAVALETLDPGDTGDPDFLDRIRTKATMFTLNDGETKTLDLKLQNGG